MSRKNITNILTQLVVFYYVKKLHSVYTEVGATSWGRLRLDLVAFDRRLNMAGVEVKSCVQDFKSDNKWHKYLELGLLDKFYFCCPPDLAESTSFRQNTPDCGILVPDKGSLRCARKAKVFTTDEVVKRDFIVKLAWIGGQSRRNVKRCTKLYLPGEISCS